MLILMVLTLLELMKACFMVLNETTLYQLRLHEAIKQRPLYPALNNQSQSQIQSRSGLDLRSHDLYTSRISAYNFFSFSKRYDTTAFHPDGFVAHLANRCIVVHCQQDDLRAIMKIV